MHTKLNLVHWIRQPVDGHSPCTKRVCVCVCAAMVIIGNYKMCDNNSSNFIHTERHRNQDEACNQNRAKYKLAAQHGCEHDRWIALPILARDQLITARYVRHVVVRRWWCERNYVSAFGCEHGGA